VLEGEASRISVAALEGVAGRTSVYVLDGVAHRYAVAVLDAGDSLDIIVDLKLDGPEWWGNCASLVLRAP
jgi:hypothetical protein